jgi:glycosyltransferase involved in cell wall biosynthesis
MHFRFLTSTPLNIARGSGTFAGIATLAKFLKQSGADVDLITPVVKVPVYTLERLIFNQMLGLRPIDADGITVGFDMDGYTLAGKKGGFHVASIKGVIADEMRFEHGVTRATMRLQAGWEKIHVQRANLVIAPSQYSAGRIQELYGVEREPRVVREAIDLEEWRRLLQRNPAPPANDKFVVLSVCRFYPRKRLQVLLGAVNGLRSRIPGLVVRIVGDGPEAARFKSMWRSLRLKDTVKWLGNVAADELAREYNRCHIFCLPSVQESFGIVFLEAMASGKPIIAARAASAPEVVKHGILVEPDNEEALAEGIEQLYRNPALREKLADSAQHWVKRFDAPLIAANFLREIEVAMGVAAPARIHAVS